MPFTNGLAKFWSSVRVTHSSFLLFFRQFLSLYLQVCWVFLCTTQIYPWAPLMNFSFQFYFSTPEFLFGSFIVCISLLWFASCSLIMSIFYLNQFNYNPFKNPYLLILTSVSCLGFYTLSLMFTFFLLPLLSINYWMYDRHGKFCIVESLYHWDMV